MAAWTVSLLPSGKQAADDSSSSKTQPLENAQTASPALPPLPREAFDSGLDTPPLQAAMHKARKAQQGWANLSYRERAAYLQRLQNLLVKDADAIAYRLGASTGKVRIDALATEVLPCALACRWYARNAAKVLRPQRLPVSTPLFFSKRSELQRLPWGVVAVISPWNYPLAIPFGEVVMGLMAGNAILMKGSPQTPEVSELIAELMAEAGLPEGLFQLISGPGEAVAAALFAERVDKVFFTGSVAVGKSLMAKASATLTPLSLELGGKDPMLVMADADLERASNGALWGGFQNAGQTCAGIERIYVHSSVYEEFLNLLAEKTAALRCGKDVDFNVDVGAMCTQAQYELVSRQVNAALQQGARIVAQARLLNGNNGRYYYPPTLLADVNHSMEIMREETFGPILCVQPFQDTAEALRLANDSCFALTSSVWSRNHAEARAIAKKLQSGVTTINDHLFTHALAGTPWGGPKNSGLGRTHGALGLEEMTQAKVINWDWWPGKRNLYWYPYSHRSYLSIKAALHLNFASKPTHWLREFWRLAPQYVRMFRQPWRPKSP